MSSLALAARSSLFYCPGVRSTRLDSAQSSCVPPSQQPTYIEASRRLRLPRVSESRRPAVLATSSGSCWPTRTWLCIRPSTPDAIAWFFTTQWTTSPDWLSPSLLRVRRRRVREDTGDQPPVTRCVPLEDRRIQSERFRRDATNPTLHALGADLNESSVRSLLLGGKKDVIGALPAAAHLRCVFAQHCRPGQRDEGVVGIVLKDERDLAGAPDIGRLARATIGDESNRPVVLVGGARQTPHWPRVDAAVLGRSR